MTDEKLKKLYFTCKNFIDNNNVTIKHLNNNSDIVLEDAYSLIENICEIIGYAVNEDED